MGDNAIKSARRVFEILEYFDRERRPLSLKAIGTRLRYPPSSGSALLKSMVALGYLEYDQLSRTYFPTMRIAALGGWVHDALFGDGEIERLLEHLHRATGETVVLAAQSGLYAQYVHLVPSPPLLQFAVAAGTRRPLGRSGMGWLLLSAHDDREIEKLRRRINADGAQKTKLASEELMKQVTAVRLQGYAFSKGVVSPGVGLIATLLPNAPFGRTFAVGIGGSVLRLQRREKLIVGEMRNAIARFTR
jgi:IclR family KDG regulon transcriptional repressor